MKIYFQKWAKPLFVDGEKRIKDPLRKTNHMNPVTCEGECRALDADLAFKASN